MSIERHLNDEITPWTGEHIHRYLESKKFIQPGDVVLDLACGSGYGSDILSGVKDTEIYGGDIEPGTIDYCKSAWSENKSLHFEVLDATDLRFDDGFFNKVVSLETIEHLSAYRKMVSEFKRILNPSGVVIISTPNIKISSPNGKIVNPFHTQEFTYEELEEILKEEFREVKIFGEKYNRYFDNRQAAGMQEFEKFLLTRGIRKLSYRFRNRLFSSLYKFQLYPTSDDFVLCSDKDIIKKYCHVLFAVCKK